MPGQQLTTMSAWTPFTGLRPAALLCHSFCLLLLLLLAPVLLLPMGALPVGAILSLQSSFNGCVAGLRSTQLQLAVDLKSAEGRLLMMLKELTLLKVTSSTAQHAVPSAAISTYVSHAVGC